MTRGFRRDRIPIFGILGTTAVSVALYPYLPGRIPVHWGISGEVDGYAAKAMGIFFTPAAMLCIYLFFLLVPYLGDE